MLKLLPLVLVLASTQVFAAPAAAPKAAAPAAAGNAKILEAQKSYSEQATAIESHLKNFIKKGATCGMIGTQMKEQMVEKQAVAAQEKSRKEIDALLVAAASNAKLHASANVRIAKELNDLAAIDEEVQQNISMINIGLDDPAPDCKSANKSFSIIQSAGAKMRASLTDVRKLLNGKQAELEGSVAAEVAALNLGLGFSSEALVEETTQSAALFE